VPGDRYANPLPARHRLLCGRQQERPEPPLLWQGLRRRGQGWRALDEGEVVDPDVERRATVETPNTMKKIREGSI